MLALALPPHALVANAFAVAATSTATTFVVRNPVNRVKRQFLGVEQKRGSFWHGGSSAGRSNECAGGVTSMASPVCCLGSIASSAGRSALTVGAANTAALLMRGGSVEMNVLGGVLAELANIRTPAALLGGAALGTMFLPVQPGRNPRLHLIYTALSTSAFSLQLVCVLCSTLTYTSAASRGTAMATSAVAYLSENMQFEFYVIRASFIYGLFSFLGALMVRGWMTYPAKGDRGSARTISAILMMSGLFLLNFLHYTHNVLTLCLGGMTRKLIWLTLCKACPTQRQLLRHCTWIGTAWLIVKVLKLGPNQGKEKIDMPRLKNKK